MAGRWKRRIRASSSVNHRLHDASTSRPVSGSIGGPPAAKTHGPWDSWPFDADRPARTSRAAVEPPSAAAEPTRFRVIDTAEPVERVQGKVIAEVERRLREHP